MSTFLQGQPDSAPHDTTLNRQCHRIQIALAPLKHWCRLAARYGCANLLLRTCAFPAIVMLRLRVLNLARGDPRALLPGRPPLVLDCQIGCKGPARITQSQ